MLKNFLATLFALLLAFNNVHATEVYFNFSKESTDPEIRIGLEESTDGATFDKVFGALQKIRTNAQNLNEAEFSEFITKHLIYPDGAEGLLRSGEIYTKFRTIRKIEPVSIISLPPYQHITVKYYLDGGRVLSFREDFICDPECSYALKGFPQEFEYVYASYRNSRDLGLLKAVESNDVVIAADSTTKKLHTSFDVLIDSEAFQTSDSHESFIDALNSHREKVVLVSTKQSESEFEQSLLNEFGIERLSKQDRYFVPVWDGNGSLVVLFTDFLGYSEQLLRLGSEPVVAGVINVNELSYFVLQSKQEPDGIPGEALEIPVFTVPYSRSTNQIVNPIKQDEYRFLHLPFMLEALAEFLK